MYSARINRSATRVDLAAAVHLTPAGIELLDDANQLMNDEIAGLNISEQSQSEIVNVLNSLIPARR